MGLLDIVILVGLGVGIIRGWSTGFIRQAIYLAGIILAFIVAAAFMDPLGDMLTAYPQISQAFGRVIAFVVVFVVVKLLAMFLSRSLDEIVDALHLGILNRVAGGFAGALKAGIVLSLVFLVIGYGDIPRAASRAESMFYEPVYNLAPEAWRFVTGHSEALQEFQRRIQKEFESRSA